MAAISPSTRPPTRSPREYVSLWICRTNQSKEKKSWQLQRRQPAPVPPFTLESAIQKVRLAEDGWNTRDPAKVALAYAIDSDGGTIGVYHGRNEIVAFLTRKWAKELGVHMFRYVATILVAILLSAPSWRESRVSGQLSHANGSDERHQPLRPSRRQGSGRGAVAWLRRYGDMWAPWQLFWHGPYRDRPRPARNGYVRSPGYRLHQEEPGGRHCRVMDALKVQKADLVTHDIGNWSAMRWLLISPPVTRWVVIDAPLPGIGDWTTSLAAPCCGTSISGVLTRSVGAGPGAHLP